MLKFGICLISLSICISQDIFANNSYILETPKNTNGEKVYKQISEYTSKDYSTHKKLIAAAKKGIVSSVRDCLNKGISPDARVLSDMVSGPSVLMQAVGERRHKVVLTLLESGADPNLKCRINGIGGITALMIASIHGPIETLSALIDSGASVNAKTTGTVSGSTALMAAIGSERDDLVAYLIESGADINAKTSNTSLSNISALMIAAEKGNAVIVKQLLSSTNIDMQAVDSEEKNALVYAYIAGNINVIELFLNSGLRSSLAPDKLREILRKYSYTKSTCNSNSEICPK